MKMTRQKLLKLGFLTAATACLAAGYALVGQWALLALAGLAWLAGVRAAGWYGVVFIGMVSLAAAGMLTGAWPALMICAATFALASWDLADWEGFVNSGLPARDLQRSERRHYTSLALALGPGLLAAILGRLVRFDLPFGILAVLAVLAILGIDRLWRFIQTKA